ncbi:PTS system cellobiose-specific IIA component [Lactobacillus colini]|uniref:PTS system cellobiose-specific IIA component n=2 Tax=Lactobacillus colini TaxID=1819254 RepID=A0ABS4MEW2_9LACO|nr:PTS lactose/cellobiose transporter subunit IIA [Lactobacillus colini]MBP2058222.1 PTS system cellobiose-specific IIA component [Lactobacillus colini]
MKENEKEVMTLISSAGDSRSKAFEALKAVRSHDYDKARKLIDESEKADVEAHNMQTKMITEAIRGEDNNEVSLLMVHAQDHYMCAELVRDVVQELIEIFNERDNN